MDVDTSSSPIVYCPANSTCEIAHARSARVTDAINQNVITISNTQTDHTRVLRQTLALSLTHTAQLEDLRAGRQRLEAMLERLLAPQ